MPSAGRVRSIDSPCLEVAEFLGDDLAEIDAEPVDDALRQVRVRRAAEHFDIRHPALQPLLGGPLWLFFHDVLRIRRDVIKQGHTSGSDDPTTARQPIAGRGARSRDRHVYL